MEQQGTQVKILTKEEWEHWREMPNIPMEVWFSYYREMGGYLDTVDKFAGIFTTILDNEMIIAGTDGEMKKVTIASSFHRMKTYFDKKFGLE